MPQSDFRKRYNRDEELKPGRPPHSSTEPKGAEGSSRNRKTLTDPATGEPNPRPPEPDQSEFDATADDG